MTVRRLLSTIGLLVLSLFLMAFQGELPVAAPGDIPWLVWLLLLLVAAGLLWLAWNRRDVDAFDTGHHDEDDHGTHGHDDQAHTAHDHPAHDPVHSAHDAATREMGAAVYTDDAEEMSATDLDAQAAVPDADEMDSTETDNMDTGGRMESRAETVATSTVIDIDPTTDSGGIATYDAPERDSGAMEMSAAVGGAQAFDAEALSDVTSARVEEESNATIEESDMEEPGDSAATTSSSLGMRERPPTFSKVEIPDTLPSARGAVKDTMEFRFGEDTPGEIVQRPYEGERHPPTPMSAEAGEAESVDVPPLDVPDLGMPALDDASAISEEERSDTSGEAGGANWFVGGAEGAATATGAPSATAAEWNDTTLEPPNRAEAAGSLPPVTLPEYDPEKTGAPDWLVTDDEESNDDLQIVEGIGPKIAGILRGSGIRSFRRLASTSVENLKEILDKADIGAIADPSTWAEQAQHAADGAMDKLQELQARLRGGRREED